MNGFLMSLDTPASSEEVRTAIEASIDCFGDCDGKTELVECAVMDETTWRSFLRQAADWSRVDEEREFPTVHHKGSLRAAREEAARPGATFMMATT